MFWGDWHPVMALGALAVWSAAHAVPAAAADGSESGQFHEIPNAAAPEAPLCRAAASGDVEAVRQLLADGSATSVRCARCRTPLHAAAAAGHAEVVRALLERGADPDLDDDCGTTPLHSASQEGHERVVDVLLASGATPGLEDTCGLTPAEWASRLGKPALAQRFGAEMAEAPLAIVDGVLQVSEADRRRLTRRFRSAMGGGGRETDCLRCQTECLELDSECSCSLGRIDTGGGVGVRARRGHKMARRVGKIGVGQVTAQGLCSRGDVSKQIRMRAGALRACYERQLLRNPALAGEVTVRWTIHLDGSVRNPAIQTSSMNNSSVEECILRTIRRIRFKKPDGGVCIVSWPFAFGTGD